MISGTPTNLIFLSLYTHLRAGRTHFVSAALIPIASTAASFLLFSEWTTSELRKELLD